MFLANNFALTDAEDNTSRPLNREFTFAENIISNSLEVPRSKFLGKDKLICFISICNFGSFSNPFTTITSLLERYFRFRIFVLLVLLHELWQQHKQLKTMEMSEV